MTGYIKYCVLLCMLILSLSNGYANVIDSLKTKEEVQKYLVASLSKNGVIFLGRCIDISQAERIRMYLSGVDTIMVEDPMNPGDLIMKTTPHDSSYLNSVNSLFPHPDPLHQPFDTTITRAMDTGTYLFYKADIDGNGYTDLVVDATVLLVVLNMDSMVEGHILSNNSTLKLQNIISLSDGSIALQLKHSHPLCEESSTKRCYKIDTVVYKFNGFVKYNPRVESVAISKIKYNFQNSSGILFLERYSCIEINRDGRCFLHYLGYDTTFSAKLNNSTLSELWNLASYIDVKSKKEVYSDWSDHGEGGTFTIHFDDGSIKSIHIWNYIVPFSLRYLNKYISDISTQVSWKSSIKPINFTCPTETFNIPNTSFTPCECSW